MEYDLELDKVIKKINTEKCKKVLIQLLDGLKPKAVEIVDELESKTDCEILVWFNSCYGGCDIPKVDEKEIDLIVQFGHSVWKY